MLPPSGNITRLDAMKRFCLCSLCSHLNVLTPPPPCLGDSQKVWVRSDFFLKQYFGEIDNDFFFKERAFFFRTRRRWFTQRTPFRELYLLGMLKRKGLLPAGTVQCHLGRGHRRFPDLVRTKRTFFSWEKSFPGNSTDYLDFSWNRCNSWLTHRTFNHIFLRHHMLSSFRLNRQRAKSARKFRKEDFGPSSLKKFVLFLFFTSPKYCCIYPYGHHIYQSVDQPGKAANPARGQLNRES